MKKFLISSVALSVLGTVNAFAQEAAAAAETQVAGESMHFRCFSVWSSVWP